MTESTSPSRTNTSKAGAGFAGAGIGTGLLAFANSLPDDNLIKPWLLFASPSVSLAASALWIWVQVEVANKVQDIKIKLLAKRLRVFLRTALEDKNCSGEHRQKLETRLHELDIIIADRDLGRLRSLTPITSDDIRSFQRQIAKEMPNEQQGT